MSNPLYNQMNRGNNNLLARFNEFRNNFKGDPKQRVQELLDSGKVTQEQYNRAVQMANQFKQMLGMK